MLLLLLTTLLMIMKVRCYNDEQRLCMCIL